MRIALDALKGNLDGERAKKHTMEISKYNRSPGSSGFHDALEYVAERMRELPLDTVKVEKYSLDGKTKALGWELYPAWEALKGSVEVASPVNQVLVSYPETPTCIPWWSASTSPEGVEAEIVDVGYGTELEDYEGKGVKGKIALATGDNPDDTVRAYDVAVEEFGAIGLITDCLIGPIPGFRSRELTPDFVSLQRLPRKFNHGWGVVIPSTKGKLLRELLAKGPVIVKVKLETKTWEGEGENLIATIKGAENPKEEVIVIGHLTSTKPGANCASGPALMIEVARTLSTLIGDQKTPRPKRTIKFLFVAEGLGTQAYLAAHGDEMSDAIGGICLCGMAQDQQLCKSSLVMFRTPDSVPSFMNDLTFDFLERSSRGVLPPIHVAEVPYTPFSDNGTLNLFEVPTTLLASQPNIFFHTQFLTWETTSTILFKVTGATVAGTALFVADAGFPEAVQVISTTATKGEERLNRLDRRVTDQVISSASTKKPKNEVAQSIRRVKQELRYVLERELAAVDSCRNLLSQEEQARAESLLKSVKGNLKSKARKINLDIDRLLRIYNHLGM